MNIKLINLQKIGDERGSLVILENNKEIPFEIKRVYYLCDTKDGVRRGFHAHRRLNQVAVCVQGSCEFLMDDGYSIQTIKMHNNYTGLVIPAMVWHEMYNFSPDCVLMILAADFYNEDDYIRSYHDFIKQVTEAKTNSD